MSTTSTEKLVVVPPATTAPVDARVERSRAKLLAAATELLVAAGPAALTVDAVAERSGVAKSTLYRHWPSREALMIDVLRENMPCIPEFDRSLGFEKRLRGYLRALADTFADPEWARILPALFSLKSQCAEIGALTDTDRDEKVAMLTELLDAGAAEGVIPAGLDPHSVAAMLVGPLMMCVLTGESDTVHQVAEFTADRFLASYRHA
ncbi:MAG: TetR/AcrR family transcriptional regulator [Ilumatobacteraceae bacterium]